MSTGRCQSAARLRQPFRLPTNLFIAFHSFFFSFFETHNQEIGVTNNIFSLSTLLVLRNLSNNLTLRSVPQVLVLNDCGIDQAGAPEDLKKKCNSVKELDLAQNKLENWNEVSVGGARE